MTKALEVFKPCGEKFVSPLAFFIAGCPKPVSRQGVEGWAHVWLSFGCAAPVPTGALIAGERLVPVELGMECSHPFGHFPSVILSRKRHGETRPLF